jgi:hypothetical protein
MKLAEHSDVELELVDDSQVSEVDDSQVSVDSELSS